MVCHAVSKGHIGGGPLNDSEEQEVLYIFILSELLFSILLLLKKRTWSEKVPHYVNIGVHVDWRLFHAYNSI